ncbi:MAG: glycoside hydrolase N-terminal domain-containing protein [Armatimonadota bacterium]|nr:glycoside hydrolase N-terminal domain-containing protein [Armatimonadota bacterium]
MWKLWYREPAPIEPPAANAWQNSPGWVRALPIGNGKLGAMIYGGIEEERIQLNEDSLWSGHPQEADNPHAPQFLPEIRRLLFEGKYAEAQRLTAEKFVCLGEGSGHGRGANVPFGCYQMLGDLRLRFMHRAGATDYRRELDLETGVARVEYRVGQVEYTREHFASLHENVIVIRLTSDKRGELNFEATLSRPERAETTTSENQILLSGELNGGLRFAARLLVLCEDGTVRVDGRVLHVQQATVVTLLIGAATTYRARKPAAATASSLARARQQGYRQLRNSHVERYRRLFARVHLSLGGEDRAALPIDERLERVKRGEPDPHLCALYFQFARYLMICSSQPGSLPANLQGVWADGIQTPWNCDYHTNINVQMNYWIAETGALPECTDPLIDFIERLCEPGRKTARVHYGLSGWVVHTVTNLWGFTSPGEHPAWGQFPAAAGWLCQHLWERYAFSLDKGILKRVYPVMKEAAEFYLGFLTPEPRYGWLVTAPSVSPENSFRTTDGQVVSVCYGPTADMQILRELFTNCIEASRILGVDEEFRKRLEEARSRLAPMQIGKHGQLQEWIEDFEENEPGHRHISHLYGLHPGNQITPRGTPELAKAARVSLERRLAHGGGHTGWSRAWLINLWARLEDGEKAHENLIALLQRSTLPNLFDNHPPFQIDGNFGGAAGIAEMLVQSHVGEVHLLPALPKIWHKGCAKGLCVRGGAQIDIFWRDGKVYRATLFPAGGRTFRIRLSDGQRIVRVTCEGRRTPFQTNDDGTITLKTQKRGKPYDLIVQ